MNNLIKILPSIKAPAAEPETLVISEQTLAAVITDMGKQGYHISIEHFAGIGWTARINGNMKVAARSPVGVAFAERKSISGFCSKAETPAIAFLEAYNAMVKEWEDYLSGVDVVEQPMLMAV